ncbi:MAG: CapA family protein [Rhodanobacter sp.]
MNRPDDPGRRRILAALALAPLAAWCAPRLPHERPFVLTLTGQALIAHDLYADPYPGLAEVAAEIQRGDVAITDLETVIQGAGSGQPTRSGQFFHAAGTAELGCLRKLGLDVLTLANNHAGDLGPAGVLATRQAVRAAGFVVAGTGANLAEATQATPFAAGGRALAVVAMASGKIAAGAAASATAPGVNELRLDATGVVDDADLQRILDSIRTAAGASRQVIACLHNHQWGQDMRLTRPWVQAFARSCVDAGASVFFAHGAPLLQGIEVYRGAPIFYCLGSLIFHTRTALGYYPAEVWQSALVHLRFAGDRLRGIELVPVQLNERGDDPTRHLETRGRPRIASGDQARQILQRLQSSSAAFGTHVAIAHGRGQVRLDSSG